MEVSKRLVRPRLQSWRNEYASVRHRRALSVNIMREAEEVPMTDILIRDVPDDVIAAIDAKAKRLGLSRTAYLRRALAHERVQHPGPVTPEHLERLGSLAADLSDPTVMGDAWS